jgi:hypothetical protein
MGVGGGVSEIQKMTLLGIVFPIPSLHLSKSFKKSSNQTLGEILRLGGLLVTANAAEFCLFQITKAKRLL